MALLPLLQVDGGVKLYLNKLGQVDGSIVAGEQ